MRRIILIARREVVAYASVPSFWIALLMGPVFMALAALALGSFGKEAAAPPAQPIAVESSEPRLAAAAAHALREAAELEGRPVRVAQPGEAARLTVQVGIADGTPKATVTGERLTPLAVALLKRDLVAAARPAAAAVSGFDLVEPPPPTPVAPDPGRFARFSMTALLWLVLVGSLGMLLQAVVRERSNRSLESLLSAVRASDLLLGKLVGVGALSIVVVSAWLLGGAAVALSPLGEGAVAAGVLFHGFLDVPAIAAAGVLFLLAFTMYGAALIAVGAFARDVPAAQNLSRPVFGVLLLIFFMALAQFAGMGDSTLPALVLLPPFTPFVLLLAKPGSIDPSHAAIGLLGMAATTVFFTVLGAQALKGEVGLRIRRPARALAEAR